MNHYAKARTLIDALAEKLALPDLKLDADNNSCLLLFEGDIVLNIEYDEPEARLVLSICVGALPTVGAEGLLRELMGANLYWHRTSGATLGLEEETNSVMLVYSHNVVLLSIDIFENIIENLINQASHWQQRLALSKAAAVAAMAEQAAQEAKTSNRQDGLIFG